MKFCCQKVSYFTVTLNLPSMTVISRRISCMMAVVKLWVDVWGSPAADLSLWSASVLTLGYTSHSQQDVTGFTGCCTVQHVMKSHVQFKTKTDRKEQQLQTFFFFLPEWTLYCQITVQIIFTCSPDTNIKLLAP